MFACLIALDTFGIQSTVITDTTGGRVCLECSFYSFSTDTGCAVELVSSDSSSCVQYKETINRSGNGTAEGCVSGVTEGVYNVRVYDINSSILQHEVTDITVLSQPTTMSPPSTLSMSFITIIRTECQSQGDWSDTLVVMYLLCTRMYRLFGVWYGRWLQLLS